MYDTRLLIPVIIALTSSICAASEQAAKVVGAASLLAAFPAQADTADFSAPAASGPALVDSTVGTLIDVVKVSPFLQEDRSCYWRSYWLASQTCGSPPSLCMSAGCRECGEDRLGLRRSGTVICKERAHLDSSTMSSFLFSSVVYVSY